MHSRTPLYTLMFYLSLNTLNVKAETGLQTDTVVNSTMLPEVTVTTDTSDVPEGIGYVSTQGLTATKTDTPIIETPQSISIITKNQIVDQGAQTLQDALRYTAGVRSDAYGLDSRGDWAFIRGTEFSQYQDGLRMFFDFFSNIRPDPYALERVEVVRGPTSFQEPHFPVHIICCFYERQNTANR